MRPAESLRQSGFSEAFFKFGEVFRTAKRGPTLHTGNAKCRTDLPYGHHGSLRFHQAPRQCIARCRYAQCRQELRCLLQRLGRPQTCLINPTSAEMSERDCCPHYGTLGIEWTQAHRMLFMVYGQLRLAVPHSRPATKEPGC